MRKKIDSYTSVWCFVDGDIDSPSYLEGGSAFVPSGNQSTKQENAGSMWSEAHGSQLSMDHCSPVGEIQVHLRDRGSILSMRGL